MVQEKFQQGDMDEWNTPQGRTRGMVKKHLTSPTQVAEQNVDASEDNSRYLVRSEKSGKEAAHTLDTLRKVRRGTA